MKMQLDDHFILVSMAESLAAEPSNEDINFRLTMLKLLKQSFLVDMKYNSDTERVRMRQTLF